jgi:hypothetical protein
MNLIEDIRQYLPKYLSEDSTKKLLQDIGRFPDNITHSLYAKKAVSDTIIFQGDVLKSMPTINLPEPKIEKAPSIILSNTCDIDLNNKRAFPSQICYAPIFQLEKYTALLEKNNVYKEQQLTQHIEKLKQQHITQILYLPIGGGLYYEGVVFLDRINNCQNKVIIRENLSNERLFSLSNYGHYLLLTKISIHFSRLQENIDRDV